MNDTIEQQRCNFILQLSDQERRDLLTLARREEFAKGRLIFRIGQPATHVYFLEIGRVKIYHRNPSGKEVLLWFCVPGELFGLAETRNESARQVCAQACERSSVLCVAQHDFEQFVKRHPAVGLLVVDVLASRIRGLGSVIEALVASDVSKRVAQLLLRLATSYGRREKRAVRIDIRITHQEMANMIGTSRQSLTSTLNSFKHGGVVAVRSGRVEILDENLLREIATGADALVAK